jgi:hypothetical protein
VIAAPTPAPYVPPAIPPTTRMPERKAPATVPPPARSRASLYAIAAVIVLAAGGAAVYFATHKSATQDAPSPAPEPVKPEPAKPDPWKPDPAKPDPAKPDPWKGQGSAAPDPWNARGAAPVHHEVDVGTSVTPVPAGDPSTGVFVGIGPLGGGTNDPKALAMQWANRTERVTGRHSPGACGSNALGVESRSAEHRRRA